MSTKDAGADTGCAPVSPELGRAPTAITPKGSLIRRSFPAALLLALAASTGCDTETVVGPPPIPDFGDADEDLTSTIDDLLTSVRAVPTSGELRGRLAMAYDINGFIDAAVVTYEQAERLDPEEFSWPYFRSLRLGDRADYENALAVLDRAISIDDGYVPTWLWRGTWLLELERYEEATAAYQRAQDIGAGSPAIVGQAQTLLRQGRHEDAIALLEPLNERLPHPYIHLLLGQSYRALGRIDDARIAMARGRQAESMRWMDPRWNKRNAYIAGFGERLVHAQNLINAGMAREALRAIEPLKAMREDDPYLISTLAWAHTSLNLLDQAAEIVEDGLQKHPDYPRFHFHLATIAEKRGDREDERRHLERARDLDPNNAAVHERLGLLATREQRLDGRHRTPTRRVSARCPESRQGPAHDRLDTRHQGTLARSDRAVSASGCDRRVVHDRFHLSWPVSRRSRAIRGSGGSVVLGRTTGHPPGRTRISPPPDGGSARR